MHSRTKVQLLVVPLFCLIVVPIILFNEPVISSPCTCPRPPVTHPRSTSRAETTTVLSINKTTTVPGSHNESSADVSITKTTGSRNQTSGITTVVGSQNESFPVPSINESAIERLDEKPLLVVTKIRWINRENGSSDEGRV
jgi:hypothetical protein